MIRRGENEIEGLSIGGYVSRSPCHLKNLNFLCNATDIVLFHTEVSHDQQVGKRKTDI